MRTIAIKTLREMIKPRHGYKIATTDAVIIRGREVLLQKRSFGKVRNHWVLPGGRVEPGEDTWQACIREAKEETGLDIAIIKMIGFYDEPWRDPEKKSSSMAFLCKQKDPGQEPRPSVEATEMGWFPIDSLPGKMGFDHRRIISDARKLLPRNL